MGSWHSRDPAASRRRDCSPDSGCSWCKYCKDKQGIVQTVCNWAIFWLRSLSSFNIYGKNWSAPSVCYAYHVCIMCVLCVYRASGMKKRTLKINYHKWPFSNDRSERIQKLVFIHAIGNPCQTLCFMKRKKNNHLICFSRTLVPNSTIRNVQREYFYHTAPLNAIGMLHHDTHTQDVTPLAIFVMQLLVKHHWFQGTNDLLHKLAWLLWNTVHHSASWSQETNQ